MAVPLAGPWIAIGMDTDLGRDNPDFAGAYAGAGLLQLGGATMLVLGLVLRDEVQVPVYGLGDGPNQRASVWMSPTAPGADGLGLTLGIGPQF